MPSRVIRGETNSSRSLARVSVEAELTFRALLLACDDYGRLEADPLILKASLFPRRVSATPGVVREWLEELVVEGCVRLYAVDGVEYLYLPNWERHRSNGRRARFSRFPDPPGPSSDSPGDPRMPEESSGIRPSDEGRGTSSVGRRTSFEGRSTSDEGRGSGGGEIAAPVPRPSALGPPSAPAAVLTDASGVLGGAQRRLEARRRREKYA